MDVVERIGSGIQRMHDQMKDARLPAPTIESSTFFCITFQDPYLFSGDLMSNVSLFEPSATEQQVRGALTKAGGESILNLKQGGCKLSITEGGQNLSRGQRQCIAIARNFLCPRPVWILDESTSSFDCLDEEVVYRNIEELLPNLICFSLAHRLSVVAWADHIAAISEGRLVEEGSPAQLLKNKGLYWNMFHAQLSKLEQQTHIISGGTSPSQ